MIQFISLYGIWVVAAFIALESIGFPLPAEAALIAAGLFAAANPDLNIWLLIAVGIAAAIVGEVIGFWIGRRFGSQLLKRYGDRLGLTEGRVKIGQWLFARYGGRFVFIARFLPFLRNMVPSSPEPTPWRRAAFMSRAFPRPLPGSPVMVLRPILLARH